VYHVAAAVNGMLPYPAVRPSNVDGVREVLRLAAAYRTVPVHHVSTLAVFARLDAPPEVVYEDELPELPPSVDAGYDRSKWVGEHIVALARERGIPVTVYRPGRIGGDTRTGRWHDNDLVVQIIRACAGLGLVPDANLRTEIVPVDTLAAMIARLAREPAAANTTFHTTGPHKVPLALLADVLPAHGYPVRRVGVSRWREELRRYLNGRGGDLAVAVPVLFRGALDHGLREPRVDTTNTARVLAGTVPVPDVDADLLGRWVDSLL